MVDFPALRAGSAALLGAPVEAAGLFVLDIGRVVPTVAMMGGAAVVDAVTDLVTEDPLTAGIARGVGGVTGKHAAYAAAASTAGLTPVMVLAVTADEVALLDWSGNVRSGTGPTRVFARFPRATGIVEASASGVTRHITLRDGGSQVRVQCTLGLLSPGKSEMRRILGLLGCP